MYIRKANIDDAAVLWRAEAEIAKTPGRLLSLPNELTLEAFVAKIEHLEVEGSYVVALDDECIVGHSFVERMPFSALRHVVRLTVVVHPGHDGRGVGTALIKHLQGWASERQDVRKIELLVRQTNTEAVRLYQRLGFREEGRLKDRVRLPDGRFVDDLAMAWFPNEERG